LCDFPACFFIFPPGTIGNVQLADRYLRCRFAVECLAMRIDLDDDTALLVRCTRADVHGHSRLAPARNIRRHRVRAGFDIFETEIAIRSRKRRGGERTGDRMQAHHAGFVRQDLAAKLKDRPAFGGAERKDRHGSRDELPHLLRSKYSNWALEPDELPSPLLYNVPSQGDLRADQIYGRKAHFAIDCRICEVECGKGPQGATNASW